MTAKTQQGRAPCPVQNIVNVHGIAGGRLKCASSFYYMPYMTAELLLDCLEAYNDVVRRVAEETGAIRFELATLVPSDDEHFNDSVHMKDPGLAIVGQCVVQALVKSPEFLALLEGEESP